MIALDAKVQVDFNPDVVAYYRLVGYENRAVADQDFRNDSVDAGEIGAGHSATAIYAVMLQPASQGRIATVQLRWQDPETYEVKEINGNFNTWDLSGSLQRCFSLLPASRPGIPICRGAAQQPLGCGDFIITDLPPGVSVERNDP